MSFATLAHTAPAPPPFDGTYFATIATIIPVLFLAIAVQGRTFKDIVKAGPGLARRVREYPDPSRAFNAPFLVTAWVLRLIAWLVPVAGSAGEAGAAIALYQQSNDRAIRLLVLIATLFLFVCVLLPAMQTFARVRLKAVEDEVERKMGEFFAAMMSSRPESAPGIPAEPEPGTTGAEE